MTRAYRIIHYDFCDLNYSGYYVEGFRQACAAVGHEFVVSRRVPFLLRGIAPEDRWRKLLRSVALFEARGAGETRWFCVDARDSSRPGADRGDGYHLPLLERVHRYFKVNHDPDAVAAEPSLRPFAEAIVPADPFFALRPAAFADALPRPVPAPAVAWNGDAVLRRLKALRALPREEDVTRLRGSPKVRDFHYVVRYYDQPRHARHMEFRFELMRALRPLAGPGSCVGFAAPPGALPAKYAGYRIAPVPLRAHLVALSAARVGVYVRGLHDCLSFKFGQFMALGLPVAGQPLGAGGARYRDAPGFGGQFAHEDPVALAHAAAELAADPARREALGAANARLFDARFAPRPVAEAMLEALGIRTGA